MSNRLRLINFFLGALCVLFVFASPSFAGIYSYKDDAGKTHFTDDPAKIPHKYRSKDKGLKRHKEKAAPPPSRESLSDVAFGPTDLKTHHIALTMSGNGGARVKTYLNGRVASNLIVDTGASMVTISPRLARKLGLELGDAAPEIPFSTAGGMVWSKIFILDSVRVGDAEVRSVEINVNDQLGTIDGLLGMSFLGEFNMTMDQIGEQMILQPLADDTDFLWAGKNGAWWKNKFQYMSGFIRQYRYMARDYKKKRHKKERNLSNLVDYYQSNYEKLTTRAVALGVPKEYWSKRRATPGGR